ncbi:outer membrane protein [Pseudoxanthomonas indica]|uniref:Opacity protein n=1 Tax=Pseudoxanthomonas indica TaxID=428993 RepID=A0A1T5LYV3_9GAMM|nr:outer membrane beta-barrel protein [Pseudoxanthomonas indica]GGD42416.1 hypothetical protein GCM10007235_13020 [Pseudoxanthomonas indica]SKC81004.1 Opacity protein [Pseudoxanthomonas indica]
MTRHRNTLHPTIALLLLATLPGLASASESFTDYVSIKVAAARLQADGMDLSARPGIGAFVSGQESDSDLAGTLAYGHRFSAAWRVEGEYAFAQSAEFTSGSTRFPTSYNHHQVETSRLMANLYRDVPFGEKFYVFGSVGLGVSRIESSGWQGNINRRYAPHTQDNLTWSLGAGGGYHFTPRFGLEAGYRWINQGTVESGYNTFTNARGLVDEQMRLDLSSGEAYLGLNFHF